VYQQIFEHTRRGIEITAKLDCLSIEGGPPANVTFLFLWPWPWPDDLDIRIWPRYPQDVSVYQKWSF